MVIIAAYIVNNFELGINPKKEQFTLTFDFPSPKKEISNTKTEITTKVNDSITTTKSTKLEPIANPAYASVYEYLTRVGVNIEVTLKLRANERRSKLKKSNYQFKINKKKNTD